MSRYAQDAQGNLHLIAGNYGYNIIAPKEISPAIAPHVAGSHIMYGNALYKVTADIAIGDTLTVGTNIAVSEDIETQIAEKADKSDLTSISATGATNTTGATIVNGKYFYKDGVLSKAIADIANNATFTLNTNYEEVPEGGLNAIYNSLKNFVTTDESITSGDSINGNSAKEFSKIVSNNGRTPVGILAVNISNDYLVVNNFYIGSNNTVAIKARNTNSSNQTNISISVKVLWQ